MGASVQSGFNPHGKAGVTIEARQQGAESELQSAYQVLAHPGSSKAMVKLARKIIAEHTQPPKPEPEGEVPDREKIFDPAQVARVNDAKTLASQNLGASFEVLASVEFETVQAFGPGCSVGMCVKPQASDESTVTVRFRRPKTEAEWRELLAGIANASEAVAFQRALDEAPSAPVAVTDAA